MVKGAEEKAASKAKAEAKKCGYPKGSKNKEGREVVLKPELLRIQKSLQSPLETVGTTIP